MKFGDTVVARVTRYCPSDSTCAIPKITPETPAWVVGVYTYHSDYDIQSEALLIGPSFTDEELEDLNWDEGYSLSRAFDEWELVPEDEWPDEVCAAVAKRALLGEEMR